MPLQLQISAPPSKWPGWTLWLVLAYLVAILASAAALRMPQAMVRGNQMTIDRAVFSAINAGTLTGFEQTTRIEAYKPLGRSTVAFLMLSGGMFYLLISGLAVVRIARLRFSDGEIISATIIFYAIAIMIGAGLFGTFAPGFGEAIFLSISAVSNTGLSGAWTPDQTAASFHLFILPLTIVGGIGLPVLMECARWVRTRAAFSFHAHVCVAGFGAVYVSGVILLTVTQWPFGAGGHPGRALIESSALALNSRLAGFPTAIADLTRASQWIVMLLMWIGAAPGGTAGGLKVTTLAIVGVGVRNIWRGGLPSRAFAVALCWVGVYGAVAMTAFLALLACETQTPADRLLFIAISAMSNIGLSPAPIDFGATGLYLLSALMLLGRALPLLIAWWMMRIGDEKNEIAIA